MSTPKKTAKKTAKKSVAKIPAFTAKEIAAIRSLRRQGKTLKEIGKALHRSDKTIAAFIKQDNECCTSSDKAKCKTPCNEKNCYDKAKKTPDANCDVSPNEKATKKPTWRKEAREKVEIPEDIPEWTQTPSKPVAKKVKSPKKGVPGIDCVKVPITDEQRKALVVGFKLLELADGINELLVKTFKSI